MNLSPLFLSFQLAAVTTIILIVIGIPLGYWLAYSRHPLKPVLEPLVSMPLVLPPTVLGFYLLLIFSPYNGIGGWLNDVFGLRLVFTFSGLVIASVLFSLPFMVNPVKAGFENIPQSLLDASHTLGKSRWETCRRILIPLIKPSILTGIIMSFAHTIGEFGVVLMMGGNIPDKTRVASIAIFSEVESLNYANAHFYSLALFGICYIILFIFHALNRNNDRKLL